MNDFEFTAGFSGYRVYRDLEKESIPHVVEVELPAISSPSVMLDGSGYPAMILRIFFASAKNASEAMREPSRQMITVRAAEEFWDIAEAGIDYRRFRHLMQVRPRRLVPGFVFTGISSKVQEKKPAQHEGKKLNYGCGAVCEYDVFYYAAYCDDEKLWEVCPEKRLCIIGGTRYPFPE